MKIISLTIFCLCIASSACTVNYAAINVCLGIYRQLVNTIIKAEIHSTLYTTRVATSVGFVQYTAYIGIERAGECIRASTNYDQAIIDKIVDEVERLTSKNIDAAVRACFVKKDVVPQAIVEACLDEKVDNGCTEAVALTIAAFTKLDSQGKL